MKKTSALISLVFASSAFCVDEYLPIEAGKTEVDWGYAFIKPTGGYDSSGTKKDLPSGFSPFISALPLQVKYGIMPGLDAEAAWTGIMSNKDAGNLSGFGQPDIALKYAMLDAGVGAYLDFIIPIATGNLDNPKPAMGLQVGAVFARTLTKSFRATATGSYRLNFENADKYKPGNVLDLYFKPEALWTEFVGTYLGIRFDSFGKSATAGTKAADDGYLLVLLPGVNTTWLKWLATEVNVPVTLIGKNQPSFWGISALVYMTFPM
jgi:hypothetical protein